MKREKLKDLGQVASGKGMPVEDVTECDPSYAEEVLLITRQSKQS